MVQLPNRVFNIFMNILVLFFLLVRAECVRCPLAYLQNEVSTIFVIILHFLIFLLLYQMLFSHSPMVHWSEQRAFADNFRGCGTILMIIPFFLLLPPEKILLVSIGGRAEGQACTDP